MRRVIDDFLPRGYFNEIKQMIEHPAFRWNFSSILPEGYNGQTEKRLVLHEENILRT